MKTDLRSLLGIMFWAVLVAGLGVLCGSAINQKKSQPLKEIVILLDGEDDNTAFMRSADIERQIREVIGPLEIHTVGDIECGIIEQTLIKNPFIELADVYVTGNAILTAKISQRQPVLRVIGQGKNFYLDSDGNPMPVSKHYTARVHVLTGTLAVEAAPDVLALVRYIREDKLLSALIEQLHIDATDELILIPKTGHTRILFGSTERIAEKCENLTAFYNEVIAVAGWNRYGTIDLRYRDQIICKKNPTS